MVLDRLRVMVLDRLRVMVLDRLRVMVLDRLRFMVLDRLRVSAACEDPGVAVRSSSLRALTQMNVNTVPFYTALQRLRTDGDPRVLQEVEQALAVLAPGLNAGGQQDVQQTGMPGPR